MESNNDRDIALNPPDAHGRVNVTAKMGSGKFYPCTMCGQEKCEASKAGRIPKYCPSCLKAFRKDNTAKMTLSREESKIFKATTVVTMPDGSIAWLRDEQELTFVQGRLDAYTREFDWTESSDMGLLTKMVLLELQTNRLAKLLTIKYKAIDAKCMSQLTEEYRKCQADLGINRTRRLSQDTVTDAHTIMSELTEKFKTYKERHPDRFLWRCQKCGDINNLNKQNPDVPVIEEAVTLVPEDAAPVQEEVKEEIKVQS